MSAIVLPVGAYDFSMNEVIHQYNPHAFTRKNTPAVKWNGKTELKENSYYYTTSAVTISRDVMLMYGREAQSKTRIDSRRIQRWR